jgi:putative lysine transport system substrate-binding protein
MSKRFRRAVLSSVAAVSVFALSGCHKSASSAVSSSSSAKETITIGLECNYAPFNWTVAAASDHTLPIDNFAGQYADGYDISFAKRMSAALGADVKVMKLEWDSLIVDLNSKMIDAIIAGMTDTAEREKSISFTDEYYRSELVLITKKTVSDAHTGVLTSADLKTLLKDQPVESQISTVTDDVLSTFATDYGAIHNTPVDTFAHAANDVATGAAFAMTAEYPVAQSIVGKNSELGIIHMDQTVLGVDLASLGVSIGIRKDDDDLKTKLNSVLAAYPTADRNADMTAAVERSNA